MAPGVGGTFVIGVKAKVVAGPLPLLLMAATETVPEAVPEVTTEAPPALPESLEAFRSWLGESPSLPLAKGNSRRALPKGAEAAEVMLLADMPTPEDVSEGQPIAGQAWELIGDSSDPDADFVTSAGAGPIKLPPRSVLRDNFW